jgi:hypothetical protein
VSVRIDVAGSHPSWKIATVQTHVNGVSAEAQTRLCESVGENPIFGPFKKLTS